MNRQWVWVTTTVTPSFGVVTQLVPADPSRRALCVSSWSGDWRMWPQIEVAAPGIISTDDATRWVSDNLFPGLAGERWFCLSNAPGDTTLIVMQGFDTDPKQGVEDGAKEIRVKVRRR